MPRLFVAIDLPDKLKSEIEQLSYFGLEGVKWVDPEQYHLSLRFIGEVNQNESQHIEEILMKVKAESFSLTLGGVGTFPGGKDPRVLWVGVEKSEPLIQLQKKIETRLNQSGIQKERRRFSPHITLARVKARKPGKIGDFIVQNNLYKSESFAVDRFCLFSSQLTPNGAIYSIEQEYYLSDKT